MDKKIILPQYTVNDEDHKIIRKQSKAKNETEIPTEMTSIRQ